MRNEAQIETLKSHALIKPYADKLEGVVVPDITVDGAFDEALRDVVGVLHLASPLPKPVSSPHDSGQLCDTNKGTAV